MRNFLIGALAVVAMVTAGYGAEKDAKAAKGPLSATVVANKDTYTLDPAQSGKAFREKLEALKKDGKALPLPPKVDLVLRITNVSEKDVTINIGGDESRVMLKLAGPGAVTMENMVAMTMDFRMGAPVTLAPGKSHDVAITSLAFGTRGISMHAYWTEAGDYTIAATLTAAMGEAQVSVESEPAKVKVEAGK